MAPLHTNTPLIESNALSQRSGKTVFLKLEAVQTPGSFKIRGIGMACQEYVKRGAKRFISSSGGNAGIAVAYAGRHLAVPVVVVVPETTTERAKALIQLEGAQVIVHGASWQEANVLALSMVTSSDAFLHPFDDPLLWRGHASMIDEVVQSGTKPGAVVLSVGGGGLLCGVVEGLHRNGWGDVPVVAVETEGAASFAAAVRAGECVEINGITSIASSLGAKKVCAQAFAWTKRHAIQSALVSDKAAVSACVNFMADHRLVVEPACGAALAVVYDQAAELAPYDSVLVIVCGGVTATVEQLQSWHKALA